MRQAIPLAERMKKSRRICAKIKACAWFKKAKHILLYYPIKGEVDPRLLVKASAFQKRFYLPAITNKAIFQALPFISFKTLKMGRQGIPEPQRGVPAKELDLILVPGIAFDEERNRLGTGKGYYDRFLKRYPRTFKLGLAYREQMVEKIPAYPYDIPMDQVLTD